MIKLLLLLLLPCFVQAQSIDKIVNDIVDVKIAKIPIPQTGDSSLKGMLIIKAFAGAMVLDTLVVKSGTGAWFELNLSGYKARCIQRVYVTNTNGVYRVESTINIASFSGLTGGSLSVTVSSMGALIKVTGNTAITEWKLIRLNL